MAASSLAPNLDWATLLWRTFPVDALECPACGHSMRVLALITEHQTASKILRALGLPHTPPTHTPARAPPELPFDLGEEVSREANAVQEQPDWENVDQSLNW